TPVARQRQGVRITNENRKGKGDASRMTEPKATAGGLLNPSIGFLHGKRPDLEPNCTPNFSFHSRATMKDAAANKGYSPNIGIANPKLLLVLITMNTALVPGKARSAGTSEDKIVFLGTFYSERFTEEHEYRNQIDLWRQGSTVFGLSAQTAGLIGDQKPIIQRLEGSMDPKTSEITLTLGNGFPFLKGKLQGSTFSAKFESGGEERMARSEDKFGISGQNAPTADSATWRKWAETVLSEREHPYTKNQRQLCEKGDRQACVGIGNHEKLNGKIAEAEKYWSRACTLGAWVGCKFSGDSVNYLRILKEQCRQDVVPSFERNFACQELGERANKEGSLADAKSWYRLGCNRSELPLTCCSRLESFGYESTEQLAMQKSCDGNDHVSCLILGGLAKKSGQQADAEKLFRKACEGIPYACRKVTKQ
ncbi:MAG TPA: hypothetical protein VI895_08475, partial [Bdellovibrionota bacterium]|nr:hypothetical protein [Bdellovibrionota bacterium]